MTIKDDVISLSEQSANVQSVVRKSIIIKKLSKLNIGKKQKRGFGSQQLLLRERSPKPINMALRDVF